jgi:heavy metal sensor kinase
MLNSVRSRLTLWYAAALSTALLVFSVLVYVLMVRAVYKRVDGDLRSVLEVTALSLNHEIEEHEGKDKGEQSFAMVLNTMQHTSFPRHAIAVFEGNRLVARKPASSGATALRPPNIPYSAAPVFLTSGDMRIAITPVYVAYARSSYEVVASERLAPAWAELVEFRRTLYAAVGLSLLFAILPGYLLARRSLAPVVAMSETADRIGSKNLNERLAVANPDDELGKLALTFNSLLGRLESAFRQQRQFMADASHELRTPISVARTASEVTLERPHRPEEEYRDALETVEQQMRRLTRVVQDMFTLARADAGVYPVEKSDFYLDELLRETARAAALLGTREGVGVMLPEFAEAPVHADESLIRQLVMILLDNAVKYSPVGGVVRLDLEFRDGTYSIGVDDTGWGIPPEAQPHIFERFFRVDKARSRAASGGSGGGGLGLAIARWIAELHNGTLVLAHSGPGGSRFVATVPGGRAHGSIDLTAAPQQTSLGNPTR